MQLGYKIESCVATSVLQQKIKVTGLTTLRLHADLRTSQILKNVF